MSEAKGKKGLSITKVEGNVKKGALVDIGEKTLIVGANGSGKSSIINIIELALTGRAGDIAGRVDVGREADVMSLAPGGSGELNAMVTFDDGIVAAYRTSGSTAKAKKATGDRPKDRCHDEVLPIRSLREAVLGSAVTARKYLLSKASGGVSRDNVRDLLPEQARVMWDKLSTLTADDDMPTPDLLVHVLEEAGKRQRAATDEAKSARNAAKLVSGDFSTPPSEGEITAARKAHAEARAAYVAADRAGGAAARLAAAEAKLAEAQAKWVAAEDRLKKATAALEAAPEAPGSYAVLLDAVKVAKASVEMKECLVCSGDVVSVPANIAQMEEAISAMKTAAAARAAAVDEHRAAEHAFDTADSALTLAGRELQRLADELAELPKTSVDHAEAELDAAQKRLSSLEAARDNWTVVQRSESIAIDADRRALEWKTLKDACEDAVARVLDRAMKEFVGRVQQNLPEGDVFDLRLRDGEREVVQLGLVRDGVLHTALSGAEWARVMAAVADACVPGDRYACIIPEERAFDPKTLQEVMKALGQSRHQVVLASPVKPTRVPAGWTVIERV
jgi:energy-coupling factor transporter ATP-binding protein EcfA2